MTAIGTNILAQEEDGGGWTTLIYVLVVVVLPLLSRLGAKIRKKYGDAEGEGKTLRPAGRPKPQPKLQPTRADRPREVSRPPVAPTARRAPAPPIPQARPTQPRPPHAIPAASVVPPAARPVEPRRTKRRRSARPAPAPPQIQLAEMLAETSAVRPGWQEKMRQKEAEEKAQAALGVKKADSKRLILPKILTANDLRTAVILSEILRPPLALREPNQY